jgi:hypothetical protein
LLVVFLFAHGRENSMPDPEPQFAFYAPGLEEETSLELQSGADHWSLHVPLPDDHAFYAMVGRVASEWAHVEHLLDTMIWDLAGIRGAIGACITGEMIGAANRFKIIMNLLDLGSISPEIISEVEAAKNKAISVGNMRNRVIHDPWYIQKGTDTPSQFRTRPTTKPNPKKYSAYRKYGHEPATQEFMKSVINDIRKLRRNLFDLRTKVYSAVRTSHDKRTQQQ